MNRHTRLLPAHILLSLSNPVRHRELHKVSGRIASIRPSQAGLNGRRKRELLPSPNLQAPRLADTSSRQPSLTVLEWPSKRECSQCSGRMRTR